MALLSNIVIDLANITAALTVTSGGSSVEVITFASNQITFASRALISLSKSDFLGLIDQVNIFETALIFNFSIAINSTTGFASVNATEAHDTNANTWSLACICGANPRVVNYVAQGSTKLVDLQNRAGSKTIQLSEWFSVLFNLNHYSTSIKSFL